MKSTKKHHVFLITLPALLVILTIPTTIAFFTQEAMVVNTFFTPRYRVEIKQAHQPIENWVPGMSVSKQVYVENSGETNVYVRIKYEESWDNFNLDTTKVKKNWTKYWANGLQSEWVQIGNWYYYKKILAAGEATNIIIENIEMDESVSNDGHDANYGNAGYTLTFIKEDIQAVPEAAKEKWNLQPTLNGTAITW